MARLLSTSQESAPLSRPSASALSGGTGSAIAWGAAGLGSIAVFGALALWFHYGTAVFFEMIASGISSCF
jgi:hypothetical protein